MEGFWQSPEIQGGVIPFAVAMAAALVIRLVCGREWGGRLAILAAGIAFLVAYGILESITWPTVSSKQKVFWLAGIALVLGLAMEMRGGGRVGALIVAHLFPIGALGWLAWQKIISGPSQELLITLVLLYLGSLVVIWMLVTATPARRQESRIGCGRINSPAMLMLVGFAAGVISITGAEIGMAQLSVAIGAVLAGVLVPSYLLYVARGEAFKFGPIGVIGLGGAWMTCIYVMVLFGSSVSLIALAILLLTFLMNIAARRIRFGDGRVARFIEPVLFGALVAIPAVVAVAYVVLTAEPDSGY